ncbi:Hypothetical predicted protein [Podarcis lilfordi]|uniref:Uncharacterized protein n=1 Tax=Podarcis lilfordi TaxID=74358 RepID=A0AA35L351_9SAUR|nr:Hypothetical predicted protein [Podarcis lilfordi]
MAAQRREAARASFRRAQPAQREQTAREPMRGKGGLGDELWVRQKRQQPRL